jgi:surfeit locus 1 family protein
LAGARALAGIAVLVSLGVWQLHRLAWKEALIARHRGARLWRRRAHPAAREWPRWSAEGDEYRRVRVTGTFLNEDEVPVHGLLSGGPGRPRAARDGGLYVPDLAAALTRETIAGFSAGPIGKSRSR